MPPKKQVEPVSEVAPNGAKPSQQTKREPLQAKKQDEMLEEKIQELKEGEVLDIAKLKEMNIATLVQVAKDLAVVGASGLRKQELIFKILQAQTEKSGLIFSQGVLECLLDCFG